MSAAAAKSKAKAKAKKPLGPTEEELTTRARIVALTKETRDRFLTAPDPTNPTHIRLAAILASVTDLAAKLEAATTILQFRDCEKDADALWEIAHMIELADPMGQMFLTDCRNHCREAREAFLIGDTEEFTRQHSWAKESLQHFREGIW